MLFMQQRESLLLSLPAGFETLQPEQGLAVLASALAAAGVAVAAVAGPLLWGVLLGSGAPRAGNPMYAEFYAARAPAMQPLLHPTSTGAAAAGQTALGAPAGVAGGEKQREAAVLGQLLAILKRVIGEDVDPDQPLMEVSGIDCRPCLV